MNAKMCVLSTTVNIQITVTDNKETLHGYIPSTLERGMLFKLHTKKKIYPTFFLSELSGSNPKYKGFNIYELGIEHYTFFPTFERNIYLS